MVVRQRKKRSGIKNEELRSVDETNEVADIYKLRLTIRSVMLKEPHTGRQISRE
jgi:hypothetical protein